MMACGACSCCAAVLYDLNEVMEDVGTVGALRRILDTCMGEDPQLRPLISRADAVLLGHRCAHALGPHWPASSRPCASQNRGASWQGGTRVGQQSARPRSPKGLVAQGGAN